MRGLRVDPGSKLNRPKGGRGKREGEGGRKAVWKVCRAAVAGRVAPPQCHRQFAEKFPSLVGRTGFPSISSLVKGKEGLKNDAQTCDCEVR